MKSQLQKDKLVYILYARKAYTIYKHLIETLGKEPEKSTP